MKDKTNFFKKFITSIYDLNAFSKYAKEGLLMSIIYVLLITMILGGIKGIFTGYGLNKEMSRINDELKSNKYSIEDGVLNINNSPIKFEEENMLVYVDKNISMDKEDSIRSITMQDDVSILILKDGIVVNNSINKYKIAYSNEIVGSLSMMNSINLLKEIIIITACMITIVTTFFKVLINCLIVVAFASLITVFMKMVVKYSALYSLALYAATLPLIIQTILEIIDPNVNLDTVFIIGTLTYVILILNYIKSELIENINKGKFK